MSVAKHENTCPWQKGEVCIRVTKWKYVSVSQNGSMYSCQKMEVFILGKKNCGSPATAGCFVAFTGYIVQVAP